jgi:adenylosuccinate lyase
VNPEVVKKNLAQHLPFMATETLLMQAVMRGGDRQVLHEQLRRHSHAAAQRMKQGQEGDLLERLAGDPAFRMTQEEVRALTDPARFVGLAPEQVDRFLNEQVEPLLGTLRPAEPLAAAEVHV